LLLHTLPLNAYRPPSLHILEILSLGLTDLERSVELLASPGPLELVRQELYAELVVRPAVGPGKHQPEVVASLADRLDTLVAAIGHVERLALTRAA
jgi:hypothetical protein